MQPFALVRARISDHVGLVSKPLVLRTGGPLKFPRSEQFETKVIIGCDGVCLNCLDFFFSCCEHGRLGMPGWGILGCTGRGVREGRSGDGVGRGWDPEGGGPKISFLFFSLSLGVFLWNFGGVLKRRDPQMCAFGVVGLPCETPLAAQTVSRNTAWMRGYDESSQVCTSHQCGVCRGGRIAWGGGRQHLARSATREQDPSKTGVVSLPTSNCRQWVLLLMSGCDRLLPRSWPEEALVSGVRHFHIEVDHRRLARRVRLPGRHTQLMKKEKDPTSKQFDNDSSLTEAQEVTADIPEDSVTCDQQDVDPKKVRPIQM